jgi:serine/threonine protein kinase
MEDFKNKKQFIPIDKIKSILFQLFTGLKYAHEKSKYITFKYIEIVHRDLKPENVLFTEDERVKICDFGSSKFIYKGQTKSTPYIVSRYYRAPELLLGMNTYEDKIDTFAAGCIMAELFTLTPIFPGKTEGLQLFEQMCILGKPSKFYFSKFNLPQNFLNFFNEMEEIIPYDLKKLLNKHKVYDDESIETAANLLASIVAWEPSDRLSAAEVLKHPFFKN